MEHTQMPQPNEGPGHIYLLELDSIPSYMNQRSVDPNVIPVHILTNDFQFSNQQFFMPIAPARVENHIEETSTNISIPFNELSHNNTTVPQKDAISRHDMDIQQSNLDVQLKEKIEVQKTTSQDQSKTIFESEKCPKIQNYVHISDRGVPPRAVAVLPTALQLRRHVISPRRSLPARTRFGPVEGVLHTVTPSVVQEMVAKSAESKSPLFLLKENEHSIYIDVSDKDKSNWLSLLPLGDETTANVWLYEDNNELFAITTQPVPTRKPLLLGYSKQYASDHGFTIEQPILDIEAEFSKRGKKWWCYKCEQGMASQSLLQYHINTHHENKIPASRPRYKCRQCTRKFTRIFTLKRHMARNCLKDPEKLKNDTAKPVEVQYSESTNTFTSQPPQELNGPEEDNRVPSDESFQNYTNGLDFSTNLFDTDRIPSLDISGNSRCEAEFGTYTMGYKDDNYLANDLGFCKIIGSEVSLNNIEITLKESVNLNQVPLQVCDKNVTKEKRAQHLRKCRAKKFECECGQSYTNKKRLTQHIFTKHSKELNNKTNTTNTQAQGKSYKCDLCQHSFKRRGMLINHLVRVHNSTSPTVPLQKRIRHYLCVACPKIYRTAAKRDRHIRKHHPGAEKQGATMIEGGLHTCEPAACTACPRQYVTKAKLLQHVRLRHPDLAASIKYPNLKSSETNKQLTVPEEELNRSALQQFLSFY